MTRRKPKVTAADIVGSDELSIYLNARTLRKLVRLEDKDPAAFRKQLCEVTLRHWKRFRKDLFSILVDQKIDEQIQAEAEAKALQRMEAKEKRLLREQARHDQQVADKIIADLILNKKLTVTAAYMKSIKDPELKRKIIEATCLSRI